MHINIEAAGEDDSLSTKLRRMAFVGGIGLFLGNVLQLQVKIARLPDMWELLLTGLACNYGVWLDA